MTARGGFDWGTEGERLGASLDPFACVVVVGEDRHATARVALGLARTQAERRRVAVGDLLGEAEPLQELVASDDPHGLVDCFVYGVSLNRVAHRVEGTEQLFILPSGSQPLEYEEMMPSPRWKRLAAGFRSEGALLVLAAPASAPGIEHLVASSDGAILVGDRVPPQLAVAQVIGSVRAPRQSQAAPAPSVATIPDIAPPADQRVGWRRPGAWVGVALGVALTLAIVAGGAWLYWRPYSDNERTFAPDANVGATTSVPVTPDTEPPPGTPDTAVVYTGEIPVPENPADSATTARYAVIWQNFNTVAGAIAVLRDEAAGMPAVTFVTVLSRGEPWHQLRVGAYDTEAEAASLLETLHGNELLAQGDGSVVAAPLAFLVDSARTRGAAAPVLARYRDRHLPAYALLQPNGRVRVYIGAYATPLEAALSMEVLRSAGVTPRLVYRTGRTF